MIFWKKFPWEGGLSIPSILLFGEPKFPVSSKKVEEKLQKDQKNKK